VTPRVPRVSFFVGPTIRPDEVRSGLAGVAIDLTVHPPIEQGSLLRLATDLPDVVAIVDGYFAQVPAVLHKEIIVAIERGARVLGAASFGALRAAELDQFGMEGVGQIYRQYRRGAIDADDEVAVLHADADHGYRPVSEALVSLRHNLRRARARRVISKETAAGVLAHARALGFADRRRDVLLDPNRVAAPPSELDALGRFLRQEAVDLKHADALQLVRTVARRLGGSERWPPLPTRSVGRTAFLYRAEREYVGRLVDGRHVPERQALASEQILAPGLPRLFRRVRLRSLLADEAVAQGLTPDGPDASVARFARSRGLSDDGALADWLREWYLSREELIAVLRELDLEQRLLAREPGRDVTGRPGRALAARRLLERMQERSGVDPSPLDLPSLMHPGVPWDGPLLRELKVRGRFGAALTQAARILDRCDERTRQHPWLTPALMPRRAVEAWLADRWGQPVESGLRARGFISHDDLLETARRVYLATASGE
jgi:hypothetical protein